MKPFSNYNETQAMTDSAKLPVGAYVCKIMGAEVKSYSWGDRLEISIDIIEGEYTGFYATNYRNQTTEDKKWKGILRLSVPVDDGSDSDNLSKKMFKTAMVAIEESNSGYHWDWNESGLKGKVIGCIFRNEEWVYNGRSGWAAQPFKFITPEMVRSGNYTLPKDKPHKNNSGGMNNYGSNPANIPNDFEEVAASDLPF